MSEFLDNPDKVKRVFQEIADLKVRAKELDEQLKVKEAIVYAFMDREKIDKVATDFGNFTRVFYPIWQFSPAVKELEGKVKELKDTEKKTGVATASSNRAQLRYTSLKDKEQE
jgi:hypothetical protein